MTSKILLKRLGRDLKRHKGQVMILTLILSFGGTAWIGMGLMLGWREDNINHFYQTTSLDDGLIDLSETGGIDASLLLSTLRNFSNYDQMQTFSLRMRIPITYEIVDPISDTKNYYRGYLYGLQDSHILNGDIDRLFPNQGEFLKIPTNASEITSKIVLNQMFIEEIDLQLPQEVFAHLGAQNKLVNVVGSVNSPEWVTTMDPESTSLGLSRNFAIGYCRLSELQTWIGIPNLVNEVVFIWKDGFNVDEMGSELEAYFKSQSIDSTYESRTEHPVYTMIEEDFETDRQLFTFLAAFVFLVAIFAIQISLNRIITQQRREIGISLSLGDTKGKILFQFLSYSGLISVFSIAFSLVGGWVFGQSMDVINQQFYPLPHWENQVIAQPFYEAWLFCLGAAFISSIIPAVRASNLLPIQAMRSDPSVDAKGGSERKFFSRMIIGIFGFNMTIKMGLRNILRSRKRSLGAIIGFGLSIGLVLGTIGVFSCLDNAVEIQKNEMGQWDAKVEYTFPIPITMIDHELKEIKENFSISSNFTSLSYFSSLTEGGDIKTDEDQLIQVTSYSTFHPIPITVIEGHFPSAADELLISARFAEERGIFLDDEITIEHIQFNGTEINIKNTSLKVAGFHSMGIKIITYFEWESMQDLFNLQESANILYLSLDDYNRAEFLDELYANPYVKSVIFQEQLGDEFRAVFNDFTGLMDMIRYLCYAVGLGVITLTSMISRYEREREIGTMATLGCPNYKIFNQMLFEGVILSLLGIVFGCGLAWVILDAILVPLMANMFDVIVINAFIPVNLWINTIITALGLSVVSQFPLILQLKKLNLVKATKIRDF
ncbi:ABC transporter permease [Candidatus Lokiarchaeum ossiferum]|uniref:ABC transporter permease n=1 Tax=Candidatus Lokiarchaeum ossiferum TaxID=2951803 RepID=UPI00352DFE53